MPPETPSPTPQLSRPILASLVLGLVLLLAWDASALDLAFARLAGGAQGFPWKDHWLFSDGVHRGGRALAWLLVAWLVVGLVLPTGVLRALPRRRVVWLLATTLGGMLLISTIKRGSATSCPWDMAEFGGIAHLVSHWAFGRHDGGPGHCFPAGHASAAFAWVAGYFAFRDVRPGVARAWLGLAIAAGIVLGLGQQWRGAHFMSHTLWTAWLCWAWACACSLRLPRPFEQRALPVPA